MQMSDLDVRGNFNVIAGNARVDHRTAEYPRSAASSRRLSLHLKYAVDALIALVGLVILSPIMLIMIAMLMVIQGRPVFIAHRRIGRHGVMFPCFKFRTMVTDAEQVLVRYLAANPVERAEWNVTRKLRNDPRITPFGILLRKSSIDEIPQLFNVVLGHMSLVGPRPIVPSEVELYGPHFADYIQVRPGLTGLWQISGRTDTSYSRRVELDVRYVREQSTWGDIVIMMKTIPAVLRAHGSY